MFSSVHGGPGEVAATAAQEALSTVSWISRLSLLQRMQISLPWTLLLVRAAFGREFIDGTNSIASLSLAEVVSEFCLVEVVRLLF
jgi:hypothetical protein